jgi:hypothetical protein
MSQSSSVIFLLDALSRAENGNELIEVIDNYLANQ